MTSKSANSVVFFIVLTMVGMSIAGATLGYGYDFAAVSADAGERQAAALDTEIRIISDPAAGEVYNNTTDTVTLLVKNVGEGTLPARRDKLDLTIDGKHTPISSLEVIGGRPWREGDVVRLRANATLDGSTHRIRVVLHGGTRVFSLEPMVNGSGGTTTSDTLVLTACPGGESAIPNATRIDDFEDGKNLSEYTGDTSAFIETDARAVVGNCSLAVENRTNSPEVESRSGLQNYPSNGTSFEFYIYRDNYTSLDQVWYGRNSTGAGYRVRFDDHQSNSTAITWVDDDGSGSDSAYVDRRLVDEWYRVRVDWGYTGGTGEGRQIINVYNQSGAEITGGDASVRDTTVEQGGIALNHSNNTTEPSFIDGLKLVKTHIDDFEDGDLSEYKGTQSASTAIIGYHAATSGDSDGSFAYVDGQSGSFREYPDQGEVTEYYFHADSQYHADFMFGVQGKNQYYRVHYTEGGKVAIAVVNQQGATTLASTTVTAPTASKWYRGRVNWTTSGKITYTVSNATTGSTIATVSATDTSYTDGGFGFYGGGGDTQVDWIHVNETATHG